MSRLAYKASLCVTLLLGLAGQFVFADSPTTSQATQPSDKSQFTLTEKPRWAFGVGLGYVAGHDYPASANKNRRLIGLPFFVYRGPVLRVGDGGVGAVAIEKPRFRFDMSVSASLNANSADNELRQGMPDLDYLLELGPRLVARLYKSESAAGATTEVNVSLKTRAVLATDFRQLDHTGWVWGGSLTARRGNLFGSRWTAFASLSTLWGSKRIQAYFYDVPDAFATENRQSFTARSGYLGSRVFTGAAATFDKRLRVFAGLQFGLYAGAANRASPLFESTESIGAAIGIVYTIAASKNRVRVLTNETR